MIIKKKNPKALPLLFIFQKQRKWQTGAQEQHQTIQIYPINTTEDSAFIKMLIGVVQAAAAGS